MKLWTCTSFLRFAPDSEAKVYSPYLRPCITELYSLSLSYGESVLRRESCSVLDYYAASSGISYREFTTTHCAVTQKIRVFSYFAAEATNYTQFLGKFAKFREASISCVIHVRFSVRQAVRMDHLDSQWVDFHEIWYSEYFFKKNLSRKFNVH